MGLGHSTARQTGDGVQSARRCNRDASDVGGFPVARGRSPLRLDANHLCATAKPYRVVRVSELLQAVWFDCRAKSFSSRNVGKVHSDMAPSAERAILMRAKH
jgi:hypothetical protein